MTAAIVDELDPVTVRGLVARASDPKRERWLQQVRRTGACRHPVRLRGVVLRGDTRRPWRAQRARVARVAYAKVAEFQARGLVHFHAIVRLDGAKDRATARRSRLP